MVTGQQAFNYFSKEKPKILMLILLVFGVFIGISLLFKGYFWTGIIVAGICGLAAFGIHIERKEYPTDEAIDESFIELQNIRYDEALQKIDFNKSEMIRKPLSIIGVANYDYIKQCEDGLIRYNPIMLEIVVFGKNQLIVNEVTIDLINQAEYKARTNEFFYKDISAVRFMMMSMEKDFL